MTSPTTLAAVAVVLLLAACGDSSETSTANAEDPCAEVRATFRDFVAQAEDLEAEADSKRDTLMEQDEADDLRWEATRRIGRAATTVVTYPDCFEPKAVVEAEGLLRDIERARDREEERERIRYEQMCTEDSQFTC